MTTSKTIMSAIQALQIARAHLDMLETTLKASPVPYSQDDCEFMDDTLDDLLSQVDDVEEAVNEVLEESGYDPYTEFDSDGFEIDDEEDDDDEEDKDLDAIDAETEVVECEEISSPGDHACPAAVREADHYDGDGCPF
jgi:hypothetical protein